MTVLFGGTPGAGTPDAMMVNRIGVPLEQGAER
jgi:hypothetical protein